MHTGQNPNVYFQAGPVKTQDVKHDRFIALPPREAVRVSDCFAYRYVAESDESWKLLHKGRLTSSRLSGLLNFWSPPNAKTLGFKGSTYEGHRRMIDAYEHLRGTPVDVIVRENVEDAAWRNVEAHLNANTGKTTREVDVTAARDIVEEMKLKKAKHLRSLGSIDHVRMSYGSAQEASTIQTLCERWHGHSVFLMEVGLIEPDHETLKRLGFDANELPPLGSTPDCLCIEAASRTDAIDAFASRSSGNPMMSIVEIKNTTPFRISKRKKAFELSDRGPRERVDAVMVPQLQFHMLASNAASAFLVSRSATKGTNVFEMPRDDEYLTMLLGIVKIFYQRYVLNDRVPPKNALSDLKEHKELLLKTKEIAWRCKLREHFKHVPLEGADMRSFLDT